MDLIRQIYWKSSSYWKRVQILVDYAKLRLIYRINPGYLKPLTLAGFRIEYGDLRQLVQLYREVFVKSIYRANPTSPVHRIVDAGANIGLTTLFYRQQYPDAEIIAFEAHPDTFSYLEKNIGNNNIRGVSLNNVAVGDQAGTISFFTSTNMKNADIGASAIKGHVEYFHGTAQTREITVPCELLSDYLGTGVDILKIDIEGSESRVFLDLEGKLDLVSNIVMEYHYHFTYSGNELSGILRALEGGSHVYTIVCGRSRRLSKEKTYTIISQLVSK